MKTVARVYLRCSTDEQDTTRQRELIKKAQALGFYVAGVYEEKASGATLQRVELQRLLRDLQAGDVIIAEHIDRLTRLPLSQAETLLDAIKAKGARISVPGLIDMTEILAAHKSDSIACAVLESLQNLLVKIMVAQAHNDYTTRRERQAQGIALTRKNEPHKYAGKPANTALHARILELLKEGKSIRKVAELLECNPSTVQRVKKSGG